MPKHITTIVPVRGTGEVDLRPPAKDKPSDPDWVLAYEPRMATLPVSQTQALLCLVCHWTQPDRPRIEA